MTFDPDFKVTFFDIEYVGGKLGGWVLDPPVRGRDGDPPLAPPFGPATGLACGPTTGPATSMGI